MSRLHCLSSSAALEDCLLAASPGDVLLLLGDGCYVAAQGSTLADCLRDTQLEIHALEEDARARGVVLTEAVIAVDYAGFVNLSERCATQHSWF